LLARIRRQINIVIIVHELVVFIFVVVFESVTHSIAHTSSSSIIFAVLSEKELRFLVAVLFNSVFSFIGNPPAL
jgi:hypothetical protein